MKLSIIPFSLLLSLTIQYSCKPGEHPGTEKSAVPEIPARQTNAPPPGEITLSEKQFKTIGIQLGVVEKKALTNLIRANGYVLLSPQQKADISPFIGGVVKSVAVIPGEKVEKGQVLAYLESTEYIQLQEDYLKAQSSLNLQQKEWSRQKEMLAANATSEKLYQQALENYNTGKVVLISLRNKLGLLGINTNSLDTGRMISAIPVTSPLTGYVQKINVNIGKFAGPGLPMFEVVDNHELFADLQVYDQSVNQVKTGQTVLIALPSQSTPVGEATIYAIDKTMDSATRSFIVHTKIRRNENESLLPGVFINGYIRTGGELVNVLPAGAIYKEGETENVFIFSGVKRESGNNEYIFSPREVRTGISEAGYTAVTFLENLPPGARIVTKGVYYIVSERNKGASGDDD